MYLFDRNIRSLHLLIVQLILLLLPVGVTAQSHGLQLALRGGISSLMGADARTDMAPMVGIDAAYAFRSSVGKNIDLGFRVGLSPAYSGYTLHALSSDAFSHIDYQGRHMDYLCQAQLEETIRLTTLETPLLLTLRMHGLTIGVGPQARLVLSAPYRQMIRSSSIAATYSDLGVTLTNQLVTGRLTPEQLVAKGNDAIGRFQVLLAAELGYDWHLEKYDTYFSERHIGLQLFATYGLWQTGVVTSAHFIYVPPILSATNPVTRPEVAVYSRCASFQAQHFADLNVGVRLYLSIESIDYARLGWHRRR